MHDGVSEGSLQEECDGGDPRHVDEGSAGGGGDGHGHEGGGKAGGGGDGGGRGYGDVG